MSEHSPVSGFKTAIFRTQDAMVMTLRRRDSKVVFGTITAVYLVLYLWAIGHLSPGLGGFEVFVVTDPVSKFFQPELGPLSFTPVARVALGPVTYLFSLNTVLGFGLSMLVGLILKAKISCNSSSKRWYGEAGARACRRPPPDLGGGR